jgi:MFS superfamily sulfate permease-like transporter
MAAVLLFLTAPLAYVPSVALAAILISSALGLFDFASLRSYYHISKPEFRHALVAMIGVMTLGVLKGVLIAIALALLNLLRVASHPRDEILGIVKGTDGLYSATEEEGAQTIPGVIIYRFQASLLFFNADHFSERVRTLINSSGTKPEYFLLSADAVPYLDVSGA